MLYNFSIGLSKTQPGKTLELAASTAVYKLEDNTWLSKDVTIQGNTIFLNNPKQLSMDVKSVTKCLTT